MDITTFGGPPAHTGFVIPAKTGVQAYGIRQSFVKGSGALSVLSSG